MCYRSSWISDSTISARACSTLCGSVFILAHCRWNSLPARMAAIFALAWRVRWSGSIGYNSASSLTGFDARFFLRMASSSARERALGGLTSLAAEVSEEKEDLILGLG